MSSSEMAPEPLDITDADRSSLSPSHVKETAAPDAERQELKGHPSVDRADLQPPYNKINTNALIRSICFVCLNQGKTGHYAIRVPCLRRVDVRLKSKEVEKKAKAITVPLTKIKPDPSSSSIMLYLYTRFRMQWDKFIFYQRTGFWEELEEDDTAIFRRLNAACFYYHGWWKRWLPFYVVKRVEVVSFHAEEEMDKLGRIKVRIIIPKEIEILEKKKAELEKKGENLPFDFHDFENFCTDDRECAPCEFGLWQCDQAKLNKTTHRLQKLKHIPSPKKLTAHVRNPSSPGTQGKSADPRLWDTRDPHCIFRRDILKIGTHDGERYTTGDYIEIRGLYVDFG